MLWRIESLKVSEKASRGEVSRAPIRSTDMRSTKTLLQFDSTLYDIIPPTQSSGSVTKLMTSSGLVCLGAKLGDPEAVTGSPLLHSAPEEQVP
jgi:hypothetical protein